MQRLWVDTDEAYGEDEEKDKKVSRIQNQVADEDTKIFDQVSDHEMISDHNQVIDNNNPGINKENEKEDLHLSCQINNYRILDGNRIDPLK